MESWWSRIGRSCMTRSFGSAGRRLSITLQAQLPDVSRALCDVRTEVLTANHWPVPGFTLEEADPVTETAQGHVLSWRGKSDLGPLVGHPIRLRFRIRGAKLYSFQFLD